MSTTTETSTSTSTLTTTSTTTPAPPLGDEGNGIVITLDAKKDCYFEPVARFNQSAGSLAGGPLGPYVHPVGTYQLLPLAGAASPYKNFDRWDWNAGLKPSDNTSFQVLYGTRRPTREAAWWRFPEARVNLSTPEDSLQRALVSEFRYEVHSQQGIFFFFVEVDPQFCIDNRGTLTFSIAPVITDPVKFTFTFATLTMGNFSVRLR
jgi:hypothetical protein